MSFNPQADSLKPLLIAIAIVFLVLLVTYLSFRH
jgi:hypothetical protein